MTYQRTPGGGSGGGVAGTDTYALLSPVVVAAPTGTYATDVAAIAAAITAAGTGGTVVFRPGTYVADSLTPLTGQTWVGNKTTLKRPGTNSLNMVAGTSLADFVLTGIAFDGYRGTATANSNSAVLLIAPTRCRIEGNTFTNHGNTNAAIELRQATDCIVRGNFISNVGYAILLGSQQATMGLSSNNIIANNVIDTTDWNAIFLSENLGSIQGNAVVGNVVGTIISGNTVKSPGDCGVESGTGTVGTQITGNTFIGSSVGNQGILFRNSVNSSATGNVCRGFTKTGACGINVWNFYDSDKQSVGITLTGNSCTGNAYNGILATNVTDLNISGGVCSNNSTRGIALANVAGFTITGVDVVGNGQQGILLGNSSTDATDGVVSGCRVKSNGQLVANCDGIALFHNTANVSITGNRIHDTQATKTQRNAVRFVDTTVTNVTVDGNDLSGNLSTALGGNFSSTQSIKVYRNRGYNGQGVTSVTVTASPMTYTAGVTPEVVYSIGGTGISATKDGASIPLGVSGGSYWPLEPGESVVITYTGAPTYLKADRK